MVVGGEAEAGGIVPRFNVGICGIGGRELRSAAIVPVIHNCPIAQHYINVNSYINIKYNIFTYSIPIILEWIICLITCLCGFQ